jgi:hypothetical protein
MFTPVFVTAKDRSNLTVLAKENDWYEPSILWAARCC